MRSLELVLAFMNMVLLAGICLRGVSLKRSVMFGWAISLVLLLLHVKYEGARWEMIPLYLLTLLPIILLLRSWRQKRQGANPVQRRRGIRLLIFTVALLYGAVAVLLPIALPVLKFEPLKGPYSVGTVTYTWTDRSRPQVHAESPTERRKLSVQFWYPTDEHESSQAAPYLKHPKIFANAFGQNEGVPPFLFDSLRLVKSRSMEAAPLSTEEKQYPVILYSHGNRGWSGQSTFLTEQLASQGYIVVGIEHAGGTNVTVFPDGTVIPFYADAGQKLDNHAFDQLADEVWVPDVKFVLDQLEEMEKGSTTPAEEGTSQAAERFAKRMDLDKIGIVGYSLGGAAAVQTLLSDDRLQAGINMDGGFYGSLRAPQGIGRPFMLIQAKGTFGAGAMSDEQLAAVGATREQYEQTVGELLKRQDHAAAGGNYVLTLERTDHTSFSDTPLYSPLLSAASGLDARGAHTVIEDYTMAFFDKYLKGEPVDLSALKVAKGTKHTLIQGQGEDAGMEGRQTADDRR